MILTTTMNASVDKRYIVKSLDEGKVNRVLACSYTAGGKGLNVTRSIVIYGEKVIATGLIGGYAGDFILENLKSKDIDARFYQVKSESRSCVNICNEKKREQTEFLEPGFGVSQEEFEGFKKKFRELVKYADVVEISGSLPKGMDGSAYQELVKIGKQAGKPVILDTSGELLRMGLEAKPTMIKPNIDEIRMLTDKPCNNDKELIDAAFDIYKSGIEIVVISLGADGSLMICSEGIFRAYVPKIKAVNTVGCGDAMIAGFAIGLEKKMKNVDSLRLANAISTASAVCSETGSFVKEEMEKYLPQIKIEMIAQ